MARGEAGMAQTGYLIQKHAASHRHYDYRFELDHAPKSWAVPKKCLPLP
jgi:hypothetical protein